MAILRYFCFLCNVLWTICWYYKILIFDVSLDINGQLRQKVKKSRTDNNVTRGKTLYAFIMSSLFLSKTGIDLKLFFDHNVRYGSSVTFKIGVASDSLQNLDNHEPQRFDFCIECKPTE